jgi:hypothetical protein
VDHESIAAAPPQRYPPETAELHRDDAELLRRVTGPDRHENEDASPDERCRCFLAMDDHPECVRARLPQYRCALERRHGAATVRQRGLLPRAIEGTGEALEDSVRAGRWNRVPRLPGGLRYDVGDLHQPPQCSRHRGGQRAGQAGMRACRGSGTLERCAAELMQRPGYRKGWSRCWRRSWRGSVCLKPCSRSIVHARRPA